MGGLDHVPDARDGLTLVERRLLHALGAPKTKRRTSRAVIDEARLGTRFPRREMYDALTRLAQDWATRYPLVSGEGNFGSIDQDPPASSQYTDVRLKRRTDLLFGAGDARRSSVPERDFDDAAALTGVFPNLLANGTSGGLASFPPHLLSEAAAAIIVRLDDRSAGLDAVLAAMPGPDYPTGGELVDRAELRAAYETGIGTLRLRGVARVEIDDPEADARTVAEARADPYRNRAVVFGCDESDMSPEEWDELTFVPPARQRIVITAVPFGTWKGGDYGLINQVADLFRDKVLSGVHNLSDESTRAGMRLLIDFKDDADPHAIRDQLFELTSLETRTPVLMVALVDGKPEQLTLLDAIDHYLDHQRRARSGSRDSIDAAIRRDLKRLASRKPGRRRTKLPVE